MAKSSHRLAHLEVLVQGSKKSGWSGDEGDSTLSQLNGIVGIEMGACCAENLCDRIKRLALRR